LFVRLSRNALLRFATAICIFVSQRESVEIRRRNMETMIAPYTQKLGAAKWGTAVFSFLVFLSSMLAFLRRFPFAMPQVKRVTPLLFSVS
jgi:hypothetical protein